MNRASAPLHKQPGSRFGQERPGAWRGSARKGRRSPGDRSEATSRIRAPRGIRWVTTRKPLRGARNGGGARSHPLSGIGPAPGWPGRPGPGVSGAEGALIAEYGPAQVAGFEVGVPKVVIGSPLSKPASSTASIRLQSPWEISLLVEEVPSFGPIRPGPSPGRAVSSPRDGEAALAEAASGAQISRCLAGSSSLHLPVQVVMAAETRSRNRASSPASLLGGANR